MQKKTNLFKCDYCKDIVAFELETVGHACFGGDGFHPHIQRLEPIELKKIPHEN